MKNLPSVASKVVFKSPKGHRKIVICGQKGIHLHLNEYYHLLAKSGLRVFIDFVGISNLTYREAVPSGIESSGLGVIKSIRHIVAIPDESMSLYEWFITQDAIQSELSSFFQIFRCTSNRTENSITNIYSFIAYQNIISQTSLDSSTLCNVQVRDIVKRAIMKACIDGLSAFLKTKSVERVGMIVSEDCNFQEVIDTCKINGIHVEKCTKEEFLKFEHILDIYGFFNYDIKQNEDSIASISFVNQDFSSCATFPIVQSKREYNKNGYFSFSISSNLEDIERVIFLFSSLFYFSNFSQASNDEMFYLLRESLPRIASKSPLPVLASQIASRIAKTSIEHNKKTVNECFNALKNRNKDFKNIWDCNYEIYPSIINMIDFTKSYFACNMLLFSKSKKALATLIVKIFEKFTIEIKADFAPIKYTEYYSKEAYIWEVKIKQYMLYSKTEIEKELLFKLENKDDCGLQHCVIVAISLF